MKRSESLLMVADTEHDANMLYATGLFVPDPFIYLRLNGQSHLVMSDLEIDRARKNAPRCRVHSLSRCQQALRKAGVEKPGFAQVISALLRRQGVRQVLVPQDFPLGLAAELEALHIRVKPKPGSFFPEREIKSPAEVAKIVAALRVTESGMAAAIRVLRATQIGQNRRLIYRGAPLTSERLRAAIDTALIQQDGLPCHTIVAGGNQGCDPHEGGHGPLRANEPVVIDIFPRIQSTGYFGDLTRTVVRGRASEAVRDLYATVLAGQEIALRKVGPEVPTGDVHRAVLEFFDQHGYKTGKKNGRMQGFFHGTGHGVGLEIHEAPRMGSASTGQLKPGHVVTVEPGLYYPGLGGVRLEDMVVITPKASRNLTECPKQLEI